MTGLAKMNPITVRLYDVNSSMVVTRFLDTCTTTSGTAAGIYDAMDTKLEELLKCPNPWSRCTSVGVDNTSVNIGIRDSSEESQFCHFLQWLPLPYNS